MNSYDHRLIFKYELKQAMIKHNISFNEAIELVDELRHQERPFMSKVNPNEYLADSYIESSSEELNHLT